MLNSSLRPVYSVYSCFKIPARDWAAVLSVDGISYRLIINFDPGKNEIHHYIWEKWAITPLLTGKRVTSARATCKYIQNLSTLQG